MKYRHSDTHKEPKLEDFGVPEDYGATIRPTAEERKRDMLEYCRKNVPREEQALFLHTIKKKDPEVWKLLEWQVAHQGKAKA